MTVIGFGYLGTSFAHLIGNKGYELTVLTRSKKKANSFKLTGRNLFCKKNI